MSGSVTVPIRTGAGKVQEFMLSVQKNCEDSMDESDSEFVRRLLCTSDMPTLSALAIDEAQKREALGLDIPLTTQNASLELTRQALSVRQARQAVFDQTLAYYGFYALPLSNVDAKTAPPEPMTGSDPTDPPEAQP